MVNMENAEEVMQILERFTRLKQKEIPKELDDYLQYVAKTGDTVFKWSSLKYLFREKLLNVMKHFHDTTPHVVEIPQYPNVDPFNYESMKSSLLERLELFNAAPFTIQRLCELLIDPRKQYSRIDKFMRALEKNILVVSTIEPGRKRTESENGDSLDSVVNGDLSLDVNVDIDMENESLFHVEAQNGGNAVADAAIAAAAAAEAESLTTATTVAAASAPASVEVKERSLTESPNEPHTADDDILPNPKKPKLDLGMENSDSAANIVTSAVDAVSAADREAQTKSAVAEKDKRSEASKVDIQEKAVEEEKGENKENMNVSEKLKRKIQNSPAVEDERKRDDEEAENSSALKKSHNKEKKVEESDRKEINKNSANSEKLSAVEQEETEVDAAIKVEIKQKAVETVSEVASEREERIIEKQEIEKGEKQQQLPTTPKRENAKDVPQEKPLLIQNSTERENNEKIKIAENLEKQSSVVDRKHEKSGGDDEEKLKKTAEKVQPAKEIRQNDVIEKQTMSTPRESQSNAKDDDSANDPSKGKIVNSELINIEPSAGGQVVDSVVDSTNKSADKNKEVEEELTANIEKQKDEMVSSACKATTEEIITVPSSDGKSAVPFVSGTELATSAETNEETVTSVTATPTSSPISFSTVAVATAASPIIIPPTPTPAPTLALNDQPMDEQQTDVAAVSSSSSANVEEVIMSEVNCGGASAMSTDAIEPTKDEPAGMEVDDTSQEAMDQ